MGELALPLPLVLALASFLAAGVTRALVHTSEGVQVFLLKEGCKYCGTVSTLQV